MASTRRIGFWIGSALLAASLATGCARNAGVSNNGLTPAENYSRGAAAYDTGDRQAAVAGFLAALSGDPEHLMARERLGDAYRELGQYDKAQAAYQAMVKSDPYTAGSWRKLGITQQFLKQYGEASDSYGKALRLDANDWEARVNLGIVRLFEGKPAEAEAELKKATDGAGSTKPQAWTNYGTVLDVVGKSAEAEQAYRKGLALKADANTHRALGDLLKKSGKQTEADEQYKLADELEKK